MANSKTDPRLLLSWIISAYRSTAFVMGAKQLKMFVKGMGEVFIDDLPDRLETTRSTESDPIANVFAFAKLEEQTGAYDKDHVKIESADGGFKVTFPSCPYSAPCGEVLSELIESGQFTKRNLPCMRSDIVSALVSESTGKKIRYELEQFAPGVKCVSLLELI
jgi:hypothetical protein